MENAEIAKMPKWQLLRVLYKGKHRSARLFSFGYSNDDKTGAWVTLSRPNSWESLHHHFIPASDIIKAYHG